MSPVFVEESPTVTVTDDGVVIFEWPNGERRGIPIRVFRETHRRAGAALDEWAERRRNKVVPFKGKTKKP